MPIALPEDVMQEILQESTDKIKAGVVEQMTRDFAATARWEVDAHIREQVKKFVEEEIAPEIIKALAAEKPALVERAVLAAGEIADELRKALVGRVTENLAMGYKRDKTLDAIFGKGF